MRWVPLLALLILGFPMVEAAAYGNVTLIASGSNTNVTFSSISASVDLVEVESTFISLLNVSVNNSCGSLISSILNFTIPNSTTDAGAFPTVPGCSGNIVILFNGLNFSIPAIPNLPTRGITPSSPLITYPNGTSDNPSYVYNSTTGIMTFNATLAPGASVLTLHSPDLVVALVSPANNAYQLSGSVSFQYTATSAYPISSCSLQYGNSFATYYSAANVTPNVTNQFLVSGIDQFSPLAGAPLSWRVSCTDEYNNTVNSIARSVYTQPNSCIVVSSTESYVFKTLFIVLALGLLAFVFLSGTLPSLTMIIAITIFLIMLSTGILALVC